MKIRPIHTQADYKAALKIVSTLVDADPAQGTPDGDRLEVLGALVAAYEIKHYADQVCMPSGLLSVPTTHT